MPRRNIIIIIVFSLLCVFVHARTSLPERIFQSVLRTVEKKALEETDRQTLLEGALDGMMRTSPYYPYSAYLPPDEEPAYEDEIQGVFAGIGIFRMAFDRESGELWFTPLANSPAQKAGLTFGDRIVAADGKPLKNLSLSEIALLLRGEEGSVVHLTIRPKSAILSKFPEKADADADLKEIDIVRGTILQEIVTGDRRREDESWEFTLADHPTLGYVRINQFTDVTAEEFSAALDDLKTKPIAGLILDLRGNPGGFLLEAFHVCNHFLPAEAEIVTTQTRDGTVRGRLKATGGEKIDWPMVVLIDNDSASAAEIVAGALADHGRATLIGTRSYGKGTVQELFSLPCDMGLLRLTDASFCRPSGAPIHRKRNAKPSDIWGISPSPGFEIPLSNPQETAVTLFRDLRSLTPITLDDWEGLKKIVFVRAERADLFGESNGESNQKGDDASSQKIEGTPPYFDPQLDRAIEFLSKKDKKKESPLPESEP